MRQDFIILFAVLLLGESEEGGGAWLDIDAGGDGQWKTRGWRRQKVKEAGNLKVWGGVLRGARVCGRIFCGSQTDARTDRQQTR